MHQFVNALQFIGAPEAAAGGALLGQKLKNYGVCSLFLGLSLKPEQCRSLYVDVKGKPYDWVHYIDAICEAERAIYSGLSADPENAYHVKLFTAGHDTWKALRDAGAGAAMVPILKTRGMSDPEANLAVTDAITAIWWSDAMAAYAAALAQGKSLQSAGKEVVKDSTRGYNEPWMILATWILSGRPAITHNFACSLQSAAAAKSGAAS